MTLGARHLAINFAKSLCPTGILKISWSLNKFLKKGSTASSESGPPRFSNTTAYRAIDFLWTISNAWQAVEKQGSGRQARRAAIRQAQHIPGICEHWREPRNAVWRPQTQFFNSLLDGSGIARPILFAFKIPVEIHRNVSDQQSARFRYVQLFVFNLYQLIIPHFV
jgi:hypothetical protein